MYREQHELQEVVGGLARNARARIAPLWPTVDSKTIEREVESVALEIVKRLDRICMLAGSARADEVLDHEVPRLVHEFERRVEDLFAKAEKRTSSVPKPLRFPRHVA